MKLYILEKPEMVDISHGRITEYYTLLSYIKQSPDQNQKLISNIQNL